MEITMLKIKNSLILGILCLSLAATHCNKQQTQETPWYRSYRKASLRGAIFGVLAMPMGLSSLIIGACLIERILPGIDELTIPFQYIFRPNFFEVSREAAIGGATIGLLIATIGKTA